VTRRIYGFNDSQIDLSARELRRGDELVRVSPRIFDCIAYLVEHRERAVGRDELMAAVWGKVDVADTQLGQAILKARRAVGDSGEEQHSIRTVPRFGYRWVAAVRVFDGDDAGESVGASPPAPSGAFASSGEFASVAGHVGRIRDPSGATDTGASPQAGIEVPTSKDVSDSAQRGEVVEMGAADSPAGARQAQGYRASAVFAGLAIAASLAIVLVTAWMRPDPALTPVSQQPNPSHAAVPSSSGASAILPARIEADADWSWLRLGLMEFVASRLRDAGQATLASDTIVAVARSDMNATSMSAAVRRALDPQWIVLPSARKTDRDWTVSLVLENRDGRRQVFTARAGDAIVAARECADRLLEALGGRPIDGGGATGSAMPAHVVASFGRTPVGAP
jgi:DNA-binding winged helix-turn-helix (wHTH) protein